MAMKQPSAVTSGSIPRGQICALFQTNRCGFSSHHVTNGQQSVHICATCIRVTGQRNTHAERDCKNKSAHDGRVKHNNKPEA